MLGFVIKKTKDLDEKLFWQFYDQGAISWIENNYHVENEDYKYCVARENIKLVYDCLKNQIPFFIDLNRKEGDPEVQNIFEIKTGQPEIDWHILLKNDLKRDVIKCNREELPKFIAKNYFFKTKHKHYAFKGVNDFVRRNLKNGAEYGKWCYPLEDRNIKTSDFLANPINYPEAIVDMRTSLEFSWNKTESDAQKQTAAAISIALALITELAKITPGDIAAMITIGDRPIAM